MCLVRIGTSKFTLYNFFFPLLCTNEKYRYRVPVLRETLRMRQAAQASPLLSNQSLHNPYHLHRYTEAIALLEKALAIYLTALPPAHPDMIITANLRN
jgi:hypothetical protein